jgi:acyl-homoserine-lactone acylase
MPTFVAIIVVACAALTSLSARAAEVSWDQWGVPHILARDSSDALFAFGWTQMRAHANAQLRLIAHVRGDSAKYFGAGEDDVTLNGDIWVRRVDIAGIADTWLRALSPQEQVLLTSFVAGCNAYAQRHAGELDSRLTAVLPITTHDVLARIVDLTLFTLGANQQQIGFATGAWRNGRIVASIRRDYSAAGSNGWAVGGSRSAEASALLMINPHLAWEDQTRLFEADISFGDVHIYGATFIGFPFIAMGFNPSIGWTHTVNPMHSFYLYELHLQDGGYLWNGRRRDFERRVETVSVRRVGGWWTQNKEIEVRSSVHGPVVAELGDRALALWVPGRDAPHLVGEYWQMAKAANLSELKAAAAQLQSPGFSIVSASRDGDIYYNFGGRNPSGPLQAEASRRKTVVDGTSDRTLWNGVLAFEALPSVTNPPTGWIQNANDPPWTATWPSTLKETDYPDGLVTMFGDFTNLRAQSVINEFTGNERITLEELIAFKHNTHSELADRVLDDLIAAGRRSTDADARTAADVLARWDRRIDATSRGASLFAAWVLLTPGDGSVFIEPFDAARPTTTPRGISDTVAAGLRLGRAARIVKELEGSIDAPWGEHHRLRSGAQSFPSNGAPDPLGMPRATTYVPDLENGGFTAMGGDSFVAAVAFGDHLRAEGLLSYGNFTQAPPRGTRDQYAMYSQSRLRPIEFDFDRHRDVTTLTEVTPVPPVRPAGGP